MENNFLLYFFALAFIIAWGGVVVCSARSVCSEHGEGQREATFSYQRGCFG